MTKITKTPHIVFWILIPIILLIGFLKPDKTLDINIHDTYFVIGLISLAVLISIIFGILGLGYWVVIKLNRRLVNWLTIIHLTITVIGFFSIILIFFSLPSIEQDGFSYNFENFLEMQVIVFYIFSLVLYIQPLYLINIIIALLSKTE
ncbi:hypothetical protein [Maribacter sp.]|uniref:hypothetical protein n=1 Tax=Maribacter sp. TaxID=1897614 RepID=UPI0025B9CC18|nr:hypothetical protein [Maribacter sp.]